MWRLLFCLLLPAALCAADELEDSVRKLIAVYAAVEREAADPVETERAFYEGAIPGLLRRLDPHSVFFDPGQFEQLKKMQTSTTKGFGSIVSVLPGRVIVLQAMPGTPSAKSGIAPGDEIVGVNGYRLDMFDPEQIVSLLSQSRQQKANIDVRRPGNSRLLNFVLTPEELQAPSVERAFHLAPGVGYLRVASFDAQTGKQIGEAIEKLGGRELKGLVLDLRNNPGGLIGAALDTAALFLKPGQTILSVRGRKVPEQTEKVAATARPYEFPVAVLLNGKSASASEIVAGALQDHDRGVILGETSFGKGLVQSVFPLSEATGIALTTSLYYTPSGRSIQKPLDAGQFELAGETAKPQGSFRTDGGRTVKGGGGIQPDYVVEQEAPTRLRYVLDASGSFTSFATQHLRRHPGTGADVAITPEILDDFQGFLSDRNIRPGISEWSAEQAFIRSRLKAELLNQAVGVAQGDEVEAQRDPVIRRALEVLAAPLQ